MFIGRVYNSEEFYNILVCVSLQHVDYTTKAVQAMFGSIVVVGALTRCALLHSI